jgi:adenine phosphoribosyltransferase
MKDFKEYIHTIPDYPKEGILFRDIQPLLEDKDALLEATLFMGQLVDLTDVDYFVGIESRGFIFASAMATTFIKGLKLIRKKGKLPNKDLSSMTYELEYGFDTIEMKPGKGKVVIVDDVFATGGTMYTAESLCLASGYEVVGKICLVDIGIRKSHDVKCLISYGESNNN